VARRIREAHREADRSWAAIFTAKPDVAIRDRAAAKMHTGRARLAEWSARTPACRPIDAP
jgi:hypothetical protein